MKKILLILFFSFFFITHVNATQYTIDGNNYNIPDEITNSYFYTQSPYAYSSDLINNSDTFVTEANTSKTFIFNYWISPAAHNISTLVVNSVMQKKINPYPYLAFSICSSSKDFRINVSSTNRGSVKKGYVNIVQTDISCSFRFDNVYYDAYKYYIFVEPTSWTVNTTAEQLELSFYVGINNKSKASNGDYTPLLWYFTPYVEATTSDRFESYSTVWRTIENAKYTENIYESASEYYDISINNDLLMYEAITDTNVSSGPFESFFNSFTDSNPGGIASIVTAPIRLINSLDDTCSPVVFSIFGKDITLPCGTTLFWDKPSVNSFQWFWNMMFGGAIIYALLAKLFKTIEKMKDPEDSSVEVMTL